jgi:hypothetical protein
MPPRKKSKKKNKTSGGNNYGSNAVTTTTTTTASRANNNKPKHFLAPANDSVCIHRDIRECWLTDPVCEAAMNFIRESWGLMNVPDSTKTRCVTSSLCQQPKHDCRYAGYGNKLYTRPKHDTGDARALRQMYI